MTITELLPSVLFAAGFLSLAAGCALGHRARRAIVAAAQRERARIVGGAMAYSESTRVAAAQTFTRALNVQHAAHAYAEGVRAAALAAVAPPSRRAPAPVEVVAAPPSRETLPEGERPTPVAPPPDAMVWVDEGEDSEPSVSGRRTVLPSPLAQSVPAPRSRDVLVAHPRKPVPPESPPVTPP